MTQGVEAEGISFILRFRDEATSHLTTAEQAYRRLVGAMRDVISTDRSMANSVAESISTVASQLRKNPYPLLTPLTASPDQIARVGSFESVVTSWYQSVVRQLTQYASRMRQSVTSTEALRTSIAALLKDLKGYGEGLKGVLPYLKEFAAMKFDLKSGPIRRFVNDLQQLVRSMLHMAKASPEFRKAMKNAKVDFDALDETTSRLSRSTQGANLHGKDLEEQLKRNADGANRARKPFQDLYAVMDKMAAIRYAAGAAASLLLLNQSVQKFSNVEDAALAVQVRMGAVGGSISDLVTRFQKLSVESGYTAAEVGGAFALIAEKSGRLNTATDNLAITAAGLAKLTQSAPEMVGSVTGQLMSMYKLTEKQADIVLKMTYAAQKGAKNMQAMDFLTPFIEKFQMFEGAAKTAGQTVDVFFGKNVGTIMAMSKALTNAMGSAEAAHDAIAGLTNAIGDEGRKMQTIAAFGQSQYLHMRDLLKEGRLEDVYAIMIKSAQKIAGESDDMYRTRLEAFSKATGIQVERVQDLARVSEESMRKYVSDLSNVSKSERSFNADIVAYHKTVTGMLNDIKSIWSSIEIGAGKILGATLGPVLHKIAELTKWMVQLPGIGPLLSTILTGVVAVTAVASVYKLGSLLASLPGIFRSITATLPAMTAATQAAAAAGRGGVGGAVAGAAEGAAGAAVVNAAKVGLFARTLGFLSTWVVPAGIASFFSRMGNWTGGTGLLARGLGALGGVLGTIARWAIPTGLLSFFSKIPGVAAGFGFLARMFGASRVALNALITALARFLLPRGFFTFIASIAGATTAAGLLSQGIILLAGAWAGWQLGKWLRENIPLVEKFGDMLGDLILKFPGVRRGIEMLSNGVPSPKDIEENLKATNDKALETLKRYNVKIPDSARAGKTEEEYGRYLQDMMRRVDKRVHPAAQSAGPTTGGLGDQLELLRQELEKKAREERVPTQPAQPATPSPTDQLYDKYKKGELGKEAPKSTAPPPEASVEGPNVINPLTPASYSSSVDQTSALIAAISRQQNAPQQDINIPDHGDVVSELQKLSQIVQRGIILMSAKQPVKGFPEFRPKFGKLAEGLV